MATVAQREMDFSSAEDASSTGQYATGIIARALSSVRGSVDFCSFRLCYKSQIWCGGLDTCIPKNPKSVCGNSIRILYYVRIDYFNGDPKSKLKEI